MNDNKAVVTAFLAAVSAKGMMEAVREYGSDDFCWWICGMGDVTPQLPHLSAAFQKIFDGRGMVITPLRLIGEGDYVAVESLTDCRLHNGDEYKNTISHWIALSDSKIVRIAEYFDSAYGQKVIGAALGEALAELH
ncbi:MULTISPECIES: nuclear transport factor 2 family protein [Sphingobium]|uniref:nuclear transport factor 2 family protein n=1 Tax=Sphingobium TaxID=165695 RepID=UPI00159CC299|nr:nuclear transport factor 2 family protein [Sphingobium sp. 15-1]